MNEPEIYPVDIQPWAEKFFPTHRKDRDGLCHWGDHTLSELAVWAVLDRAGVYYGACDEHMASYLRNRFGINKETQHRELWDRVMHDAYEVLDEYETSGTS
jgi:hypothetical protein